jgi:transposase
MRLVEGIATYGIDLGKSKFHVVGVDDNGHGLLRRTFRRAPLLEFFANAPATLIGMEACPGSHWLARKLTSFGHTVRIIPAQFVKPFVKSNKNDAIDAAAIAEAVTRPSMRFVAIKRCDQFDIQALHRVRDRLVSSRTRLISQMRAFLLEYGIALHNGAGMFRQQLPTAVADERNELTPAMRTLLMELWDEFKALDERIISVSHHIEALAARDDSARRLMSIPGIGALTATALVAAIGDGKQFRRGRDLAAWLGLVPKQYSTGGKPTLLGISKRGNPYVRRLLIHGARTCVLHLDRRRDRLGAWLDRLCGRMHSNKLVVALANELARIAWTVLTRPGTSYERMDPRFAN